MTSPIGTPVLDDALAAVEATAEQIAARIASIGAWGTAGPSDATYPLDVVHAPAPRWDDGWWTGAIRKPAHPGRVGGPINPIATCFHTTDMLPGEWAALINGWTTRPGDGACAHFLIGRTEQDGVVQCVPITRNGNHLGGPHHGSFVLPGRGAVHPNLVTNGIEVHCAGGVVKINGAWRLVEAGVAHGAALPDDDVIPDPNRPGRGWHKITDYQFRMLRELLDDLNAVQAKLPVGTMIARCAGADPLPPWAHRSACRVVGHVEMDPTDRSDPWPAGLAWLKARAP